MKSYWDAEGRGLVQVLLVLTAITVVVGLLITAWGLLPL